MGLKINVDINNLSTDCNKMTDLISELKNLTQKMTDEVAEFNGMWDGNTAKQIPFIPENPVVDDLKNLDEYSVAVSNKRLIPFAYNYVDASVYSIDLADTYCCSTVSYTHLDVYKRQILLLSAVKNVRCL